MSTGWNWRTIPRATPLERVVEVLNQGMLALENTLGRTPQRAAVRSVTVSGNLTGADAVILADTTGGSVTLALPAAGINRGQMLQVKKTVAANTVTLDGIGSETIDGAATLAWTTQYQSYTVVSDGSQWLIV